MRKRLALLICLVFIISISISYILSTVVFEIDSNSVDYSNSEIVDGSQAGSSEVTFSSYTIYIVIFLFLILVYLVYHIFYVELSPFFKMRKMKRREDPLEVVEYLFDELKRVETKNPQKAKVLSQRLKHFYDYLPEEEKKEALEDIRGLRKYIN